MVWGPVLENTLFEGAGCFEQKQEGTGRVRPLWLAVERDRCIGIRVHGPSVGRGRRPLRSRNRGPTASPYPLDNATLATFRGVRSLRAVWVGDAKELGDGHAGAEVMIAVQFAAVVRIVVAARW